MIIELLKPNFHFMITKVEFYKRIKSIPKTIPSITGRASYTGFRIEDNILHFHRIFPKTNWNLNMEVRYRIYVKNSFINTSAIKKTRR